MAEILDGQGPKLLALYLPQFHEIPENNDWWGKGFTEWTNIRKAKALYEGHNQPRVPLNKNYYDLTDDSVKKWQADLARKYGIFGFCYYHYWFKDGKKLLEKPAEQMLADHEIDLPFCFCWANENWSRNWDGGNFEVIMEQDYGTINDWQLHFDYLLQFFNDPRYITYEGKPVFIIYKPEQIIDIKPMIEYFRTRAVKEGFPGLCCVFQFPVYYNDMFYDDSIFDFRFGFEPTYSRNKNRERIGTSGKVTLLRKLGLDSMVRKYRKWKKTQQPVSGNSSNHLSMFFYDEVWQDILTNKWEKDFWPGAFVDWDNTPRNKHGVVYNGYSAEKFRAYMTKLIRRAKSEGKPCILINAWNEWCEGAYLEPDETDQYGRLAAIRDAMLENESIWQ